MIAGGDIESPPARDAVVLAVDVGGTSIKAEAVDVTGRVLSKLRRPTPAREGANAIIAAVLSVIRSAAATCPEPVAVGLVVPGDVDSRSGVARHAANMGWHDVPFREIIATQLKLPAVLEHDVRAAGLAERTVGAARGVANSLVVMLGTGIAAVITAAGQPILGETLRAGEIGHMPVWPGGERCPCGQRGCLERYASAAAVYRRYRERGGHATSAAEVASAAGPDSDDPVAREVWAEATTALGIAFATCTMLVEPRLIVLAGGLASAGARLRDPVVAALRERVRRHSYPDVVLSPLGDRAALLGGAILAWREAGVQPAHPVPSAFDPAPLATPATSSHCPAAVDTCAPTASVRSRAP